MILVQSILDDASNKVNDPNKGRLGQARWLQFYNDATEYMTVAWKIREQDATHDIAADEDRYTYPDDCMQMSRWRWSETPSDTTTYEDAGELFEDEFRMVTNRSLPSGDTGFRYWARPQFFQITPRPTVLVQEGGLLTYWKIATAVIDPAVETFELPPAARMFARDHMVISAKRELGRNDEWPTDLVVWEKHMDLVWDRLEDRSDDRRERIRPESLRRRYHGQV